MKKRHIITTIIIAGLFTMILFVLNINSKDNYDMKEWANQPVEEETFDENDETEYDENAEVLIDLPNSLNSIVEGASWSGEHFCTAGGETFFLAEDESRFTSVLCTSDKILIEDPSLDYVTHDLDREPFLITVGEKSVMVDFSDPKSVKQLSALNFGTLRGFKRQRWSNVCDYCDRVTCPLEIDYPKSSVANSKYICRWIANVALARKSEPIRIALSPSYFTTAWKNRSGYKNNIENRDAVNEFIASKYFEDVGCVEGTNERNFSSERYSCLSLRARYFTGHYVTYQLSERGYGGGAHGWSTVELVTYDHVNHQEVDWMYLFRPGSEEQVLKLFEKAAETDEQYVYYSANFWNAVQLTDDEDMPTGEMFLPQPALTPTGVTVSFPPYDLAGFAAGSFHLTVPYSKLKPYLTDRAKKCIGLK